MHVIKSITLGRIASVLSGYLTKTVLFSAFFFQTILVWSWTHRDWVMRLKVCASPTQFPNLLLSSVFYKVLGCSWNSTQFFAVIGKGGFVPVLNMVFSFQYLIRMISTLHISLDIIVTNTYAKVHLFQTAPFFQTFLISIPNSPLTHGSQGFSLYFLGLLLLTQFWSYFCVRYLLPHSLTSW